MNGTIEDMLIIGITGGIGHGKTTFAEQLSERSETHRNWESSELIIEVANPLRQASQTHPISSDYEAITQWLAALPTILSETVHIETSPAQFEITSEAVGQEPANYTKLFEYLDLMQAKPERQHVLIDTSNKTEFRRLLQWLGGYLVKTVDPGIWFDEIVRQVKATKDIELATIGGLRFPGDATRIQQAGGVIVRITRPELDELDEQDLTERERTLIRPDISIMNNGSLEQLQAIAKQVFADLKTGKIERDKIHTASDF